MTYRGKIRGGVVVLDQPADLAEGTEVTIQPVEQSEKPSPPQREESLSEVLLKFAGKAQGLPPDAARNHDHYLYGTPKR
jgi:hypothetical protein